MSTITITITKKGLRENSKLVSAIADWAERYVQLEYPESKDDIESMLRSTNHRNPVPTV